METRSHKDPLSCFLLFCLAIDDEVTALVPTEGSLQRYELVHSVEQGTKLVNLGENYKVSKDKKHREVSLRVHGDTSLPAEAFPAHLMAPYRS